MADSGSSKKPATRLVTGGRRREWTGGAVVNPPVWRGSTHLYDSTADLRAAKGPVQEGKFFYGRRGGPTHWALAEALTELEPGAAGTYLFPSGVAAISCALLAVLKPGDTLLLGLPADEPIQLLSGGRMGHVAAEGELGRKGNRMAVRVTKRGPALG